MKKIKILNVSKNPSILKTVRQVIGKEGALELIGKRVNTKNVFSVIDDTKPQVILLDFDFQNEVYDLVEKIAAEKPMCVVVGVAAESADADEERMIRAGARECISFPFQPDSLVNTIKEVTEGVDFDQVVEADSEEAAKTNKIFTVFSPKGGVGTSMIATNLAIILHKNLKEDVLIIDGKHEFGHVALYFNLRTGNSIGDLVAHAGGLDEQLIKQVVVRHASGVHVLPSPLSLAEAQGIKPKDLFKVIQSLKEIYPTIVVDGGNNLNENAVTYMDSSDRILLVLNSDIASMRDMRQFMEVAATLSYPKEKSLLLLNMAGKKNVVKREEIENILKMKIFGRISADDQFVLSSLNEGVPMMLKKPRHPISKAINEISKKLMKNIQGTEAG